MRDHLLGWQLPAEPLGPAITDDDCDDGNSWWSMFDFERKNRRAFYPTDPAEWKRANPKEAGWYIVGSKKDGYSATIRCHFDGQTWGEWVGLVDSSVRGTATEDKWREFDAKWFRKCLPQDLVVSLT